MRNRDNLYPTNLTREEATTRNRPGKNGLKPGAASSFQRSDSIHAQLGNS